MGKMMAITDRYAGLPPLLPEQLLMDALADASGTAALVVSVGRAQLASQLAAQRRFETVHAWHYDLFSALQTEQESDLAVEVLCSADLPDRNYDLIAIPRLRHSEAELTRDLMQQAHQRLCQGGVLAVSVDNPRDTWLHEQMSRMFPKVTCNRHKRGVVYLGKKREELKKFKNFACEFAFRDEQQRLLKVVSRPGVFSHRRLDVGARQLMRTVELDPEDNVLDMGCGSGAVALACAAETSGRVFGVDSNARAIECLQAGARLNQLDNVEAILNADGRLDLPCPIDVALANPPYYGGERMIQHFVETCRAVLRTGGALLVVTRRPREVADYMDERFEDLAIFERSKYWVVCGRKPAS